MTGKAIGLLIACFAVAATMQAGPARADAIDGNWCSPGGKHISIDGPRIVTPGGTKMKGEYGRHGFRYVVPPREKPAGARVEMRQIDEDSISVTIGKGQARIWRRCKTVS
ncbi:MAG: hypothetical protein ACTSUD_03085 [Alphaproteobacteria bacterium]